jgi:hypothetical protein
MSLTRRAFTLSRRTALTRFGVGGLIATLASTLPIAAVSRASAQGAGDLASHPLTGWWMAMANPPLPDDPQIAVPSFFSADGSVVLLFPVAQAGPNGLQFNAACGGTWVADSDRRGHFTAVQSLSDANGTFLGTTTIDGFPEVNEDGMTFIDDGSRVTVTIRDPAGAIVDSLSGAAARPVTATRMGEGSSGFPEASPAAGTPAS